MAVETEIGDVTRKNEGWDETVQKERRRGKKREQRTRSNEWKKEGKKAQLALLGKQIVETGHGQRNPNG